MFSTTDFSWQLKESCHGSYLLVQVVLCGAFYPNYFRWGELDEEMCMKLLSGHNPSTTVMVSSMPLNQS